MLTTNRLAGAVLLLSIYTGFFVYTEPAPTDLFFLVAFVLVLLGGIVRLAPSASIYLACAFALILTNALSGMFCHNFSFCVKTIGIRSYLLMFPLVIAHLASTLGTRYIEKMYVAFTTSVVISASAGILARFGFMPGPTELYFREELGLRLSPFFQDPNVYGPYLVAGFLILLGRTLSRHLSLFSGATLLLIVFLPLVLAFSRGAWLSLAMACLAYFPIVLWFGSNGSVRSRLTYLIIFALLIIVPLTAAALYASDLVQLFERRLGLQRYDDYRFEGHARGFLVAIDNPLGIGPGHFVGRTHFPGSQFELGAHNVYLKLWVENGLAALMLLILMKIYVLASLVRCIALRDDRLPIQAAVFSTIIGISINGYFIDTIHWRHLFVIIGFALVEIELARVRSNSRRRLHARTQEAAF